MGHTGEIGALDGNVAAVVGEGKYFVTSSNQHHVFAPPLGDQRQVRLRSDSRYGDDDPVLWPQPYMPYHSHFGAIPRPFALISHQIMWWTLTHEHFPYYVCPGSPITGLGKVSSTKIAALDKSITTLLDRVKLYELATPSERLPPISTLWSNG